MSKEKIVRYTQKELGGLEGRTDWERLDALSDEEIEQAVAKDPDAAPLLDKEWFRDAELIMPQPKVPVSLRVDGDVLKWFRSQGRGYQSRMNSVLRAYMNVKKGTNATR